MKYCLNSRQNKEYLDKADEIKVEYRDRDFIFELCEKYPGKTIILIHNIYDTDPLEWKTLKKLNILSKGNFILCLDKVEDCLLAKENDIKFYLGYPVASWYEARALKELGVSYILLDAPLCFDLEKAMKLDIPIRAIPNVAYNDGLPREDGVCGKWIRPEDIDAYAQYITAIEFQDCDIKKEQALYRLYAEQKVWPGDLSMIITNLNHDGLNRLISSDASLKRMNCGQSCMRPDGTCKLCYRMLDLANKELLQEYEKRNNTSEGN